MLISWSTKSLTSALPPHCSLQCSFSCFIRSLKNYFRFNSFPPLVICFSFSCFSRWYSVENNTIDKKRQKQQENRKSKIHVQFIVKRRKCFILWQICGYSVGGEFLWVCGGTWWNFQYSIFHNNFSTMFCLPGFFSLFCFVFCFINLVFSLCIKSLKSRRTNEHIHYKHQQNARKSWYRSQSLQNLLVIFRYSIRITPLILIFLYMLEGYWFYIVPQSENEMINWLYRSRVMPLLRYITIKR